MKRLRIQKLKNLNPIHFRVALTSMRLIYSAIAVGQVAFLALAWFVLVDHHDPDVIKADAYKIIAPTAVFFGVFVSGFVFSAMLKKPRKLVDFRKKMMRYRDAMLVNFIMVESPVVITIFCYLITAYYIFAVLALLNMLWFFLQLPTRKKIVSDLRLSEEEKELLYA